MSLTISSISRSWLERRIGHTRTTYIIYPAYEPGSSYFYYIASPYNPDLVSYVRVLVSSMCIWLLEVDILPRPKVYDHGASLQVSA